MPEGARVLVALSGGPDSCALLLALLEAAEGGLVPMTVAAAHYHHGVRGVDADEDAGFCAALCTRYRLPCVIGIGAVPSKNGGYSSVTARRLRYQFLTEAAEDMCADILATAHTADDQAETVFGRVLRGTSVDGLAGIPKSRRINERLTVVRPVLGMCRKDIEAYCTERGVQPRHDPSNDKDRYVRTRLRQTLPELAKRFNPQLYNALLRLAENAGVDADVIRTMTEELEKKAVLSKAYGSVTLDVGALTDAHQALRSRVLLSAIRQVTEERAEEAATWEWVTRIEGILDRGGRLTLPGAVNVVCAHGQLHLVRQEIGGRQPKFCLDLSIPGVVSVESLRLQLEAALFHGDSQAMRERGALSIEVAADPRDAAAGKLVLRSLEVGERFRPFGLGNRSRSVRDILSEVRVSVSKRDGFPVVARGDTGEILWIIGIAQSESTRVTPSTQRKLLLSAYFDGKERGTIRKSLEIVLK